MKIGPVVVRGSATPFHNVSFTELDIMRQVGSNRSSMWIGYTIAWSLEKESGVGFEARIGQA